MNRGWTMDGGPRPHPSASRLARVMMVAAAGLAASPSFAQAPAPADARWTHAIAEGRERAAALRDTARVAGLSVAVAVDGALVWSDGFGWADVERRTPAAPETVYGVGSVSKPLTAAALARLVERGVVNLDAAIGPFVPGLPEASRGITFRQLATHTGGVRHYDMRDFAAPARPATGVRDRLALFAADPLVAPPGQSFAYSSYGYVLLSAAMEGAAGRGFLAIMRDEVFAPHELASTGADPGQGRRAVHYLAPRDGGWTEAPERDLTGMWAGAGFYATAPELARFGSAMMRPGYLREETRAMVVAPATDRDGTGYALGWRVGSDANGRRIVHHGGSTADRRAFVLLYPEHGVSIAILTNGPAAFAEREVARVAEPFLP